MLAQGKHPAQLGTSRIAGIFGDEHGVVHPGIFQNFAAAAHLQELQVVVVPIQAPGCAVNCSDGERRCSLSDKLHLPIPSNSRIALHIEDSDCCSCISAKAMHRKGDMRPIVRERDTSHLPVRAAACGKIKVRAAHDPVNPALPGEGDGGVGDRNGRKGNGICGEADNARWILRRCCPDLLQLGKLRELHEINLSFFLSWGGECNGSGILSPGAPCFLQLSSLLANPFPRGSELALFDGWGEGSKDGPFCGYGRLAAFFPGTARRNSSMLANIICRGEITAVASLSFADGVLFWSRTAAGCIIIAHQQLPTRTFAAEDEFISG